MQFILNQNLKLQALDNMNYKARKMQLKWKDKKEGLEKVILIDVKEWYTTSSRRFRVFLSYTIFSGEEDMLFYW